MLGVTALLVGTVFLTSIFVQTVLGFNALSAGVAFLPFALAITAGTHLASQLLARTSPRTIAATGSEVGAALGVAVLSAVATTAGSLTSPAGVVAGFSRAFDATAIVAVLLAVVAFVRMPSTRATGGGNLHMH